jgi:hypothetical protein
VGYTYNSSYSEGGDQEGRSSKAAQANDFVRPYLENTWHKKGLVEWLKV